MKTIEQKVKNVINRGRSFENQDAYKKFKQASAYYENLIRKGGVSKRGYCLKTISDIPIFKYGKNVM
jgi:hypothetical protein